VAQTHGRNQVAPTLRRKQVPPTLTGNQMPPTLGRNQVPPIFKGTCATSTSKEHGATILEVQGGSNMTGTDFFVTIIDKHLLAHAQCCLFTHKSVPVIFEPPCIRMFGMKSNTFGDLAPCGLISPKLAPV